MADERSRSEKTADESAQRGSHSEQQQKIDQTTAPKDREGQNPQGGAQSGR